MTRPTRRPTARSRTSHLFPPFAVRSALGRERAAGIGEARPSVRAGASAAPTKPTARVPIGNLLLL